MKEKAARKATMTDLLDEYQSNSPKQKQIDLSNETVQDESWSQTELLQIKEYNDRVHILDPLYSSVTPLTSYIVRVFLIEPKESEGVFIPYKQLVSVPTANGMAEFAEIESPFPYSNRAVIVSTPMNASLIQKGDIVQLANNPVRPQVQGRGHNASVTIPAAYIHPDAATFNIPKNITDRHYGYLNIPVHEILAKL